MVESWTIVVDQGPVSHSLFSITNNKNQCESADNQSEARISLAYNKNCQVLWNGALAMFVRVVAVPIQRQCFSISWSRS